jgi:hypothetical protein
MKDKLFKHFQAHYCVKIGHPTDNGVPATNLIYYTVASKDGKNDRGKINDDEWATNVLKEIGEEYSSENFMLVLRTSNEFIESFNVRLGIRLVK